MNLLLLGEVLLVFVMMAERAALLEVVLLLQSPLKPEPAGLPGVL